MLSGFASPTVSFAINSSAEVSPTAGSPQPMSTSAPREKSSSYRTFVNGCSYPTNLRSFGSSFGAGIVYVRFTKSIGVAVVPASGARIGMPPSSSSSAWSVLPFHPLYGLNSGRTHVVLLVLVIS